MTELVCSTIEILERHIGERMPDTGGQGIIAANVLRINGDDIWSAKDYPVEVGPIGFYPLCAEPVIVPVVMLVRLTEADAAPRETPANRHAPPAATLELHSDHIVLNGRNVLVAEQGVEILWRYQGTDCARVRVPFFARRVVIDDEPVDRSALSTLPMLSKWGLIGDDIPTPAFAA